MKKRNIYLSLVAGFAMLLSSCAITSPYAVSDASVGSKKGISKTLVLGSMQLNGKHSVAEATKNGKLNGGVSTVDIKTTYFLGPLLYTREIIVHGE